MMHKSKSFLILALLFLFLAAIFVVSKFHSGWPKKGPPQAGMFELAQIERLQIGQMGFHDTPSVLFTLVKARQGDQASWRVPDLRNALADEEKINRFLAKVVEVAAKIREGRASKTEHFDFEQGRFHVALYDGEWHPLLTLLIGNRRNEQGALFVREEGFPTTYVTNTDLLEEIDIHDPSGSERLKIDPWLENPETHPDS